MKGLPMDTPHTLDDWQSPINPRLMGEQIKLGDVQWDSAGKGLLWIQSSSGKGSIQYQLLGKAPQNLSEGYDVGGQVGYGGGDFSSGRDFIVFAGKDGRLYRRTWSDEIIKPITPPWGKVASPVISPDQRWVMFLFSDGENDFLAVVNSQGFGWPAKFVYGADFYMQPAWHPDGNKIAWVEWDHPYLPWQTSRVKLGEVGGMQVRLLSEQWIAGDEENPASQPQFSPDGKWLSYICSIREWDQLVVVKLKNGQRKVLVDGEKVLLSSPTWVQGVRSYGWCTDSQSINYIQNYGGKSELFSVKVKDGKRKLIPTAPFTWLSQLSISTFDNSVAFIASSPRDPKQVLRLMDDRLFSMASSSNVNYPLEYLPEPHPLEWCAKDGMIIHALFYPPSIPQAGVRMKPPLIIQVHGGPTTQQTYSFDLEKAYFTSRGYAVLAVNYRGSSGYGRSYQDALRNRWGIVDVEDTIQAAHEAVARGLVDEEHLALMGRSAGGFTALNVLIHQPGLFKATICSYPVTDLIADAQQTHKLEKYYHRYLVGDLKKEIEKFKELSPLLHVEKICDPLALFHGEDDPVVSPQQSALIAKDLQRRGVPCVYKVYEKEGHGFRRTDTLVDYYQQIENFFQKYLLA